MGSVDTTSGSVLLTYHLHGCSDIRRLPTMTLWRAVLVICAAMGMLVAVAAAEAAPAETPRAVPSASLVDGLVVPKFVNVTSLAGVTTTVPDGSCGKWVSGAAWGDVNGDGYPDLYVTRLDQPTELFINDGHGHFTEHAADYGVQTTDATAAVSSPCELV